MSQLAETTDTATIRTFCHGCQQDIKVTLPKAIVENASSYPVSHAYLHGDPAHVLIVYIDRQYLIRGTELSDTVTVERPQKSLPLNAMVLLRVPRRYRETAMAMLKLRQANAADIASITGKSQNAESKYLGALFRLGYLERSRLGRFYQYSLTHSTR
ncbi:MAG: hypothetical protein ACFFCH_02020 [Promethearchaeota archaeon]